MVLWGPERTETGTAKSVAGVITLAAETFGNYNLNAFGAQKEQAC